MTGRLAALGTLGGFIGSILISGFLLPQQSEFYSVRMAVWNVLQVFSGLLVQGMLVLMSVVWSRIWRGH